MSPAHLHADSSENTLPFGAQQTARFPQRRPPALLNGKNLGVTGFCSFFFLFAHGSVRTNAVTGTCRKAFGLNLSEADP